VLHSSVNRCKWDERRPGARPTFHRDSIALPRPLECSRSNAPNIIVDNEAADSIDRKDRTLMATVATPLRIGLADHGRTMTLDEFLEAEEEEGYRYELARGVLEVSEVPNDPHGDVVANLYDAISRYRRDHPGVIRRYGGGNEFRFWLPRMISGRNPDLGVVLHGAPKDWRGRRIPVLAAEVVSRGHIQRDYQTKREEYLAYGLLEYWIVDPLERKVTVLTRRGDAWDEAVFRDDQAIGSLVLPRFATTVAELWIDVEEEDEDNADDPGANGL
jgi:Uma2 family endonuclease